MDTSTTGLGSSARDPANSDAECLSKDFELWRAGCEDAKARIITKLYDELATIAHLQLSRQRRTPSLQTRALQHQAIEKILRATGTTFVDKKHLLALAVTVMRQILVDLARKKQTAKHQVIKISLDQHLDVANLPDELEVLHLHQALTRLKALDEEQHQVAELKFFGGFSNEEVSDLLNLSLYKVKMLWEGARYWLRSAIDHAI